MNRLATAPTLVEVAALGETQRVVLRLDRVTKHWASRRVLDDITLEIGAGELVWLEGDNGVGKTTLLRILTGMIHPTTGSVLLDGLHPERDRREYLRRVGFLSAGDRALYPRLSARRQLRFAASIALIPPADQGEAVAHVIEAFRLEEIADRRADRLSTGQRQRVRLAMSLIHRPRVIVLDEPTNSLDREGLDILGGYLRELCGRGGAAIAAAPSGTEVGLHFDREFRLEQGKLVRR